jgi:peptide/nickel transport system permease protein
VISLTRYQRYLGKKLLWYLLTFVVVLALNFFLPRMIKGNPVDVIIGKMAGMGSANTMRSMYEGFMKEFNLDKSIWEQFILFIKGLLHGDLGTSFSRYPKRVSEILSEAIPWTLGLQIPTIVIGWVVGNLLGAITAYRKGIFSRIIYSVSLFVNSIPYYAFAIILMYLLAIGARIFPPGGAYSNGLVPNFSMKFILNVIQHHALPFLSCVLIMIGGQAMGMRSMAIYELNADYVLYAKLMAIPDKKIVKYVFRNAMLPQVSGLALSLGTMVSGSLITEIVFNYPGLGYWLYLAIRQLDYPLISGCTLLISITVLIANFLVDMVYGLIDPRIRAAQEEEGRKGRGTDK